MFSVFVVSALLVCAVCGQEVIDDNACAAWNVYVNDSVGCTCVNPFDGVVECTEDGTVSVLKCYCITLNSDGLLSASPCLFTCSITGESDFVSIPRNISEVNEDVCGRFNRKGSLCSRCKDGFGVAAFSIHLQCVECKESHWLKYFAMTLLPLTAFFLVVVVLRFRATSAWLDAYIFFAQIITSPTFTRLYLYDTVVRFRDLASTAPVMVQIAHSVYGIWNLNFFQALVPPFCIAPGLEIVYVFALDFVNVVYPLFLVVITYILVELHDRNFKPLVILWRPFRRLFIRFHNQVSAKNSIVDVFATFILLSYVKLVSVSSDLLHFTILEYPNGTSGPAVWLQNGTTEILEENHIPFGVLAILGFSFAFIVLVFLILYPCKWFQAKVMRRLPYPQVREFVDCFQGHYNDGTNGTRDFRYFSAIYLLIRVVHHAIPEHALYGFLFPIGGLVILSFALLIFAFQPYKKKIHNTCNGGILVVMAAWILMLSLYQYPITNLRGRFIAAASFEFFICLVPFLYLVTLLAVFIRRKCVVYMPPGAKLSFRRRTTKKRATVETVLSDNSYPDRVSHPERYHSSMRLSVSMRGGVSQEALQAEAPQRRHHEATPTVDELDLDELVAADIPGETWRVDPDSRRPISATSPDFDDANDVTTVPATHTAESAYQYNQETSTEMHKTSHSFSQEVGADLPTDNSSVECSEELKKDLQVLSDSDTVSTPVWLHHQQEVRVDVEEPSPNHKNLHSDYNLWS